MKCPRCNGEGSVPYHIADDLFDETNCPLCGGSCEVEIRGQNAKDLKRAWKKFLKRQDENVKHKQYS